MERPHYLNETKQTGRTRSVIFSGASVFINNNQETMSVKITISSNSGFPEALFYITLLTGFSTILPS